MARRDADTAAKHETVIEHVATALEDDWDRVFAVDVPTKHGAPSEIDGYRPDVVARTGDRTLVVEVETDPTEDTEQRQVFTDWASADPERAYVGVLTTDYDSWERFESEGTATIAD